MVQHDSGLRMCPRFQGDLKFLRRKRLHTTGEITMRRKIQTLKVLKNKFLTNTSAIFYFIIIFEFYIILILYQFISERMILGVFFLSF